MSRPVAVLAEIDEAISYFADRADVLDGDCGQPEANPEMLMEVGLTEARAAVAELVDAGRAYFAALDNDGDEFNAEKDLRAALAKFGGAK